MNMACTFGSTCGNWQAHVFSFMQSVFLLLCPPLIRLRISYNNHLCNDDMNYMRRGWLLLRLLCFAWGRTATLFTKSISDNNEYTACLSARMAFKAFFVVCLTGASIRQKQLTFLKASLLRLAFVNLHLWISHPCVHSSNNIKISLQSFETHKLLRATDNRMAQLWVGFVQLGKEESLSILLDVQYTDCFCILLFCFILYKLSVWFVWNVKEKEN